MYRLPWRLPLADLVAFSYLQFSQIRGRQPYSIVRKILYLIAHQGEYQQIRESRSAVLGLRKGQATEDDHSRMRPRLGHAGACASSQLTFHPDHSIKAAQVAAAVTADRADAFPGRNKATSIATARKSRRILYGSPGAHRL